MAFSVTGRSQEHSGATSQADETTASFTPAANSLLLFCGHAELDSFNTAGTTNAPSGLSLSYTEVNKHDSTDAPIWGSPSADFRLNSGLWRADVGGSPATGTITWDGVNTVANAFYSIIALDVTGHNVADPVAQVAENSVANQNGADSVSLAVTLPGALTVGNLVVVFFGAGADSGGGFAAPTIGGQSMTQVYNRNGGSCQNGAWYRVITGAESNSVITCTDLGEDVGNGTAYAIEIKADAGGSGTATPAAIAVSTSIPQATPTVPVTVSAAGSGNSATSTATLAFDSGGFAAGDMAVVVVSADNNGTNGAASLTTVQDTGGNTYTQRQIGNYDPGAAAAGQTVAIYTAPIVTPISSTDDITVNFSPNTTSKAAVVWRLRPGPGYTLQYATGNVTAGSATGTPTVTTSSLSAGQVLIGGFAGESNATPTGDSDTSNGVWSTQATQVGNTGTSGTSSRVASQWKLITGAGTQTYNLSITSCDNILAWIAVNVILADATATPAATAVTVTLPAATATGQVNGTATPGPIAVAATLPAAAASGFNGRYPASISGRKVLDQLGDVYLMPCMASWGMPTQLSNADITTALDDVAANGFKAVLVFCGGGYEIGSAPTGWNKYTNENGDPFWTGTPWASSLGSGWSTYDHIVDETARLGLTLVLAMPGAFGDTGAADDWEAVTNTNMYDAGVAIATRFLSAPHIQWHIDLDDTNVTPATTRGTRIQNFFDGVNDTEGSGTRPVRWMEVGNGNSTDDQGWFGNGFFNATINCIYSYDANSVEVFETGWAQTTAPTGDCEPRYIGNDYGTGNSEQQTRERNYSVFIEGGCLINFGHEDWWPFGADGLFTAGLTWDQVQASDPLIQASYCWALIDDYCKDATWSPTSSFVTTGQGSGDTKAAQGASDTAALAYFPNSRTIVVDTTIIAGTDPVRLRWFDPTNNSFTSIAVSEAQNATRSVTHPGNNSDGLGDWVLVVDQATDALVTPGAIAVAATVPQATPLAGSVPTPAAISAPITVPQATPLAGSTVTPAAIAAPVSIPQATPLAGSVPTPAAIAVPVTLPQATAQASKTTTPGVISVPVTLPTPTTQAGAAATPTVITVPVTLGAVTTQAGSAPTPAAIAVVVTLPAATASGGTSATATPDAIPVPATLPTSTPQAGSTAAPAAIPVPITLPAATASNSDSVTPDAIAVPITVPAVTTQAGSTATVAAISVPITIGAVAATGAGNIAPAAISVVVAMPAPTASGAAQGTAAPNVISVATSIPQATPLASSTVTPGAIDVVVSIPAATASGASSATATPNVISVSTTLPAASIVAGSTATPATIAVPVTIGQAIPGAGATVTPDVIDVNVTIGTPVTGNAATATPGAIQVTVAMPAPAISADGLATPDAIAVLISVLAATIIFGQPLESLTLTLQFPTLALDAEAASAELAVRRPGLSLTVE